MYVDMHACLHGCILEIAAAATDHEQSIDHCCNLGAA